MSAKRNECGRCAWQRRLVCANPRSDQADRPVSQKQPACEHYHEQRGAKR